MKLLEVEWFDSHSEEGWITPKEAIAKAADNNAIKVYNTGFLVDETEEYLLLAAGISPGVDEGDKLVMQTMQIPKVCVLKVRVLLERPF